MVRKSSRGSLKSFQLTMFAPQLTSRYSLTFFESKLGNFKQNTMYRVSNLLGDNSILMS